MFQVSDFHLDAHKQGYWLVLPKQCLTVHCSLHSVPRLVLQGVPKGVRHLI